MADDADNRSTPPPPARGNAPLLPPADGNASLLPLAGEGAPALNKNGADEGAVGDTLATDAFITKWQGITASELSTSQSFLIDLCALLGVDMPHAAAPWRRAALRHSGGARISSWLLPQT